MKKHLRFLCITLLALLLFTSKIVSAEEEKEVFKASYAFINADRVNVRSGRGTNFEIIGQLNKDDGVITITQKQGWYNIKLPEDALCFVHKDYVKDNLVIADKLRVRASRGTNFNILGILHRGDTVEILAKDGDWLKIAPPKGFSGWIKENYITLSEETADEPSPKDLPPTQQLQQIKIEGTVDESGKIIGQPGTHKLIKNKEIVYYLQSESVDLNYYTHEKVDITGELISSVNSAYSVINVTQITLK